MAVGDLGGDLYRLIGQGKTLCELLQQVNIGLYRDAIVWIPIHTLGGQSGAAVTRPHGNHQDVGSNPATARNEKTDIGQTPAQKVPQ